MTRIIAGAARGRVIAVPTTATRPTSDRVREALFSSVGSRRDLHGARVLDLYAGTGAVGLEALSRGAGHVLMVESDRAACGVLARNVAAVGLTGAEVRCAPVRGVLEGGAAQPYDLVFLDPPYQTATEVVTGDLEALLRRGWLDGEALVVVERARRSGAMIWPAGLVEHRSRRYGDTTLYLAGGGGA